MDLESLKDVFTSKSVEFLTGVLIKIDKNQFDDQLVSAPSEANFQSEEEVKQDTEKKLAEQQSPD